MFERNPHKPAKESGSILIGIPSSLQGRRDLSIERVFEWNPNGTPGGRSCPGWALLRDVRYDTERGAAARPRCHLATCARMEHRNDKARARQRSGALRCGTESLGTPLNLPRLAGCSVWASYVPGWSSSDNQSSKKALSGCLQRGKLNKENVTESLSRVNKRSRWGGDPE